MTKTYLLPACYVLLRVFKLKNSGQSSKEFIVLPSEPISKNISNSRALLLLRFWYLPVETLTAAT